MRWGRAKSNRRALLLLLCLARALPTRAQPDGARHLAIPSSCRACPVPVACLASSCLVLLGLGGNFKSSRSSSRRGDLFLSATRLSCVSSWKLWLHAQGNMTHSEDIGKLSYRRQGSVEESENSCIVRWCEGPSFGLREDQATPLPISAHPSSLDASSRPLSFLCQAQATMPFSIPLRSASRVL